MAPASDNAAAPGEPGSPGTAAPTYEQFLDGLGDPRPAEWVRGSVLFLPPASRDHARLSGFLYQVVAYFVSARELGDVYAGLFQMKTGPNLPGRTPDLMFVSSRNLGRLRGNFLDGPADLVVEVADPATCARDRGEKYYEYEEGGVEEYWLLDPQRQKAEFYRRDADGRFQPMAVAADTRFESAVLPGLSLKTEWLWQRPLPALPVVLKEWGASLTKGKRAPA